MGKATFMKYIRLFIYYFLFSILVVLFLIILKSIYLIIYGLFLGGKISEILPFIIDRYDFLAAIIISFLSGVIFPFLHIKKGG